MRNAGIVYRQAHSLAGAGRAHALASARLAVHLTAAAAKVGAAGLRRAPYSSSPTPRACASPRAG
eukprot:6187196-Pleurochrysis_carterae.AAC.1